MFSDHIFNFVNGGSERSVHTFIQDSHDVKSHTESGRKWMKGAKECLRIFRVEHTTF